MYEMEQKIHMYVSNLTAEFSFAYNKHSCFHKEAAISHHQIFTADQNMALSVV